MTATLGCMNDIITIVGNTATEPEAIQTSTNKQLTRFRLAASKRRFNSESKQWEEASTNWYTVRAWGKLAEHVRASVSKGQQIIVHGRLKIDTNKNEEGQTFTNVIVDADTVGVSLQFGTASFQRSIGQSQSQGQDAWAPNPGAESEKEVVAVGADADPPF